MLVLRGDSRPNTPTAVTIGNFDGMHLGHQSLLKEFQELAIQHKLPTLVVIFEPQPKEFFSKLNAPSRLLRLRDKLRYLQKLGIDFVYCLHFNARIANIYALNFVQDIIFKQMMAKFIFVGQDFRFGKDRGGDTALLVKLCQQENIILQLCPDFTRDNLRISSTAVRNALAAADFAKVNNLLGRDYSMLGKVAYGASIGRKFGVPTVNIAVHSGKLALYGVYIVKVKIQYPILLTTPLEPSAPLPHGRGSVFSSSSALNPISTQPNTCTQPETRTQQSRARKQADQLGTTEQLDIVRSEYFYGVANIGCRPTLGLDQVKNVLEVHILDFDEDLYGQNIEVLFLHKIRDEKKYASLELLFEQIKIDISFASDHLLKLSSANSTILS
jgi:riboflavin kinase / FMN adenylyltransferase